MNVATPREEARKGVRHLSSEQKQPQSPRTCQDVSSWPVMICVLGNFRLLAAGELVPTRAGGKREALLSLLALQSGRRLAREQLLEALWPDSDPNLASTSLRVLVHRLHQLLSPTLQGAVPVLYEEGFYRLNTNVGVGVDVTWFDRLVIDGDRQLQSGDRQAAILAYDHAAQLYRDDLQLVWDAQAIMERERLRTRYMTLLAQLAEYHYQTSNYTVALEYLWRLLARDPYREDAHRLVMRCFVRRGERAAALHQYQVCVTMLRREFDAAPEAATVALFDQIRVDPDQI